MKKAEELKKEIIYYAQKLTPIKQMEALDFIKWLWGGPGVKEEEYTKEELVKLEKLAKEKKGKKYNRESLLKYLDSL